MLVAAFLSYLSSSLPFPLLPSPIPHAPPWRLVVDFTHFSLSFTTSRGKYPCVTSCQNIHIIGAEPSCVPALGGKGQNTSLKIPYSRHWSARYSDLKGNLENGHRRDENIKYITTVDGSVVATGTEAVYI